MNLVYLVMLHVNATSRSVPGLTTDHDVAHCAYFSAFRAGSRNLLRKEPKARLIPGARPSVALLSPDALIYSMIGEINASDPVHRADSNYPRSLQFCSILGCVQLSTAGPQSVNVGALAATLAKQLSTLCPSAPRDDVTAHAKCAESADWLRDATFIRRSRDGLLFGGDQPNLWISKRQLTYFKPSIWQLMYLSLFTFTGRQWVNEDPREHIKVIHTEPISKRHAAL